MNHTTPFPMETPTTRETLIEQQQRIVAALQLEVAGRIQGGVQYRRELESVGFAIEILDRLTRTNTDSYEPVGLCRNY